MSGTSDLCFIDPRTADEPVLGSKWLKRLHVAALWAAVMLLVAPASAQKATKCTDFQDDPPAWLFSGELASGGGGLVLVDSLYSKVYAYSLDGRKLQEFLGLKSGPLQVVKPSWIRKAGKGSYLIEDEDGKIVQLDSSLNVKKVVVDLLGVQNSDGQRIGSIWGWQVSADNGHVFAFGDIQNREGNWSSAFMLIPVRSPESFKVVHAIELGDPTRTLFLLGNSYIATSRGDFYFVSMEKNAPAIYKVPILSGIKNKVVDLPLDAARRLNLPEKRGVSSAPGLFAALEQASLPVGIYSSPQGAIFVLSRSPLGQGKTHWELARLDVEGRRFANSQALDIEANHVVVIPREESWIFITKGSVQGLGQQKVRSICTVSPE